MKRLFLIFFVLCGQIFLTHLLCVSQLYVCAGLSYAVMVVLARSLFMKTDKDKRCVHKTIRVELG